MSEQQWGSWPRAEVDPRVDNPSYASRDEPRLRWDKTALQDGDDDDKGFSPPASSPNAGNGDGADPFGLPPVPRPSHGSDVGPFGWGACGTVAKGDAQTTGNSADRTSTRLRSAWEVTVKPLVTATRIVTLGLQVMYTRDAYAALTTPSMAASCGLDPTQHCNDVKTWRIRQEATRRVQVELGLGPKLRRAHVSMRPPATLSVGGNNEIGLGGGRVGSAMGVLPSSDAVFETGVTVAGISVEQELFGLAHPELLHAELVGFQRAIMAAMDDAMASQLRQAALALRTWQLPPRDASAPEVKAVSALATALGDRTAISAALTDQCAREVSTEAVRYDTDTDGSDLVVLRPKVRVYGGVWSHASTGINEHEYRVCTKPSRDRSRMRLRGVIVVGLARYVWFNASRSWRQTAQGAHAIQATALKRALEVTNRQLLAATAKAAAATSKLKHVQANIEDRVEVRS